jgi:nucleotide-binding universal stress UspA family protein
VLDHGDPGPLIVAKAKECGASAIVMGSRGQGKIRRTVLGSVSDYILHHSDVPVLISPLYILSIFVDYAL